MLQHLIIATSCFPNCHPTGQPAATGLPQTGNAALGLASIGLIVLFFMRKKGGSR